MGKAKILLENCFSFTMVHRHMENKNLKLYFIQFNKNIFSLEFFKALDIKNISVKDPNYFQQYKITK